MRFATLSLVCLALVTVACEASKGELRRGPCEIMAEHIRRRVTASEADRARILAGVEAATSAASYALAESDLRATHSAAFRLGGRCLTPRITVECLVGAPPRSSADVETLYARPRTLADGFAGRGPCANTERHAVSELCKRFGQQLQMEASTTEIPQVIDMWAGDNPDDDLTSSQRSAQDRVSEWRAFLDYARELVPVCVAQRARATCTDVGGRVTTAPPREILDGMIRLGRAFERGTDCSANP